MGQYDLSNNSNLAYAKGTGQGDFSREKPYTDSVFPSKNLRLLALARYWNIVHYFYPYKDGFVKPWDSALTDLEPRFRLSPDTIAYHLAILELTAGIHDSHAASFSKYTNQYFGTKLAPFRFRLIGDKAVVLS